MDHGKPSNHQLPKIIKARVFELIAYEKYEGFGPTFMCEKLLELHSIKISIETARRWMIECGVWHSLKKYMLKYKGLPNACYSDRHGIFKINIPPSNIKEDKPVETQFGRACRELGICLIWANSSQAKGRVERMFRSVEMFTNLFTFAIERPPLQQKKRKAMLFLCIF